MTNWRDAIQSRADPLLAFMWDIIILGPGVTIDPGYVEAVNIPLPKIESNAVVFQGRKYYYAKFEDFGVMSMRLYEDVHGTSIRHIRSWQKKIKADNGNYNTPKEYKGTILVWQTAPDGKATVGYKMHGVFPTQVPDIAFQSTADPISHQIEFSVDMVEVIEG